MTTIDGNEYSVGIVTTPGCVGEDGKNSGTSISNPDFWNAVDGNSRMTIINLDGGDYFYRWFNNSWGTTLPSGTKLRLQLYQDERLKADQGLYLNKKFNYWNIESNIINFGTFYNIDYTIPDHFTGQFNTVYNNIKIRNNSVENSTLEFGSISLLDPWYLNVTDSIYGIRNGGMDQPKVVEATSPFVLSSQQYQNNGIFLNQSGPSTGWLTPYYSVSANSPISKDNHNYYFINWSADINDAVFKNPNNIQTPVEILKEGAIVNANFKGTQLSDNDSAFISSSQRKIIQYIDGVYQMYHMVYESMGMIWYEISPDGIYWQIANNGKPLSKHGKQPSIDFDRNDPKVVIVWDEKYGSKSEIMIGKFNLDGSIPDFGTPITSLVTYLDYPYSNDIKPVISFDSEQKIMVCWILKYNDDPSNNLNGIYGWHGHYNRNDGLFYTDCLSSSPIISCVPENICIAGITNLKFELRNIYEFAWEENNNIHYCELSYNYSNPGILKTVDQILNAGYPNNNKPSIIAVTESDLKAGARLTWIGSRPTPNPIGIIPPDPINGGLGGGGLIEGDGDLGGDGGDDLTYVGNDPASINTMQSNAVFINPDPLASGTSWSFGTNVQSVNINNSPECYSIAWGRNNTSPIQFTDSHTLHDITTMNYLANPNSLVDHYSLNGKDVQISNGSSDLTMRAFAFNTNSQPYVFENKNLYYPSSGLSKVIGNSINNGREGVVHKDSAQFYFAIGDIKCDNNNIEFTSITDTTRIKSLGEMNNHLVTNPIQVTNNSNLYYSVQYGITDSVQALNALKGNSIINFKVEIIDAATDQVISVSDNVNYDSSHVCRYNNISYQVLTDGIGNRAIKLRLTISTNANIDFNLKSCYATEDILQKRAFKHLVKKHLVPVYTFALSQNYPNPFNPTTTIRYQIPKAGNVSLKIYDILGKEIASIVNEYKKEGNHYFIFNASRLASGVYIYSLKVNDYVASKKMIFLK